jgi:hypothetical protein
LDWNPYHFKECGWYLDFPKDNIVSLKVRIKKKYDHGFLEKLNESKFVEGRKN